MFAVVVQKRSRSRRALPVQLGMLALASVIIPCALWAQASALVSNGHLQQMEQRQKQMLAEERQRKMQSDAAKLVEMAQKLKTSVDKTNKDVLSVDVIKESERIEKLAREVREGMRQ